MAYEKEKKTAVALEYTPGEQAPKVIASGRGYLADKIIDVAKEENVPIHKDEKLARSLSVLDIGEYIPVKKEERKTIMTTRAQIQQEYGIVDTMPSYIADRELSPKEEENYRKIMDARKDGELVVDGFDLDR